MNELKDSIKNKDFIEIRIIDLFEVLDKARKFILIFVLAGAILSIYSALSATKIYYSDSVLAEAESFNYEGNSAAKDSLLGGLVSLSSRTSDKYSISIKYLTSRDFFRTLYEDANFLKELMFSKSFNSDTNQMTFFKMNSLSKPSFENSYEAYLGKVNVSINDKTGFTDIRTKHMSPFVAQDWNKKIIKNVNAYQKNKEITQAEKSLAYFQLRLESSNIDYILLKNVYTAGISSDLQTLAMAAKTDEFAFTIVDSPHLPIKPSEPSRRLILILGTFVSFVIAILIVLILYFSKRNLYKKISDF